jgi:WD40 repeat protein
MATDHLVEARRDISSFSFQRAADRIAGRKRKLDEKAEGDDETGRLSTLYTNLKTMAASVSQVGSKRPLSACRFNAAGSVIATGDWDGLVQLWNVGDSSSLRQLHGHTERVVSAGNRQSSVCII